MPMPSTSPAEGGDPSNPPQKAAAGAANRGLGGHVKGHGGEFVLGVVTPQCLATEPRSAIPSRRAPGAVVSGALHGPRQALSSTWRPIAVALPALRCGA